MLDQQNLIYWDEANQIEHFIRSAEFGTASELAGFIAPTPSIPQIDNARGELFDRLRKAITETSPFEGSIRGGMGGGGKTNSLSSKVQEVQRVQIAGYDAITVAATDANALSTWMQENEFETGDGFAEWVNHYIKKDWYLTLFRVNKIDNRKGFKTGPIRMSFRTAQPYNPYYIPAFNTFKIETEANNPAGQKTSSTLPSKNGKKLGLYFISQSVYQPIVGESMSWEKPKKTFKLWKSEMEAIQYNMNIKVPKLENQIISFYLDEQFASGAKEDLFFYRGDELKLNQIKKNGEGLLAYIQDLRK